MTRFRLAALLALIPAPALADERRVMVTGYDSIRVEGPFEVAVTTGGSSGATIVGDPRAIDGVDLRVEDRVLVVAAGSGGWGGWPDARDARPRILATAPAIRRVTMFGNGRLTIDRMRGQEVAIALSGSGTVAIGAVEADQLEAVLNGAATLTIAGTTARGRFVSNGANGIDAARLAVRDLTVQSESANESRFLASQTATITSTGLGAITVDGSATCTVSGPGPVRCGTAAAD